VSGYLDLAKKVSTKISSETGREELASRGRRKLEEAGRRGLVVRWSEYPSWEQTRKCGLCGLFGHRTVSTHQHLEFSIVI
jgi:hypothetical protein